MSTQIFISWSGEKSHQVAALLHEWIPTVLQSAEPFLSSTDIEKGSRWSDHVAQKLEECGFGVIVLTKDNLTALGYYLRPARCLKWWGHPKSLHF